jgi:hypothetical protein
MCGLALSTLPFAIIAAAVIPLVDIVTVAAITVALAALILFAALTVVIVTATPYDDCCVALHYLWRCLPSSPPPLLPSPLSLFLSLLPYPLLPFSSPSLSSSSIAFSQPSH